MPVVLGRSTITLHYLFPTMRSLGTCSFCRPRGSAPSPTSSSPVFSFFLLLQALLTHLLLPLPNHCLLPLFDQSKWSKGSVRSPEYMIYSSSGAAPLEEAEFTTNCKQHPGNPQQLQPQKSHSAISPVAGQSERSGMFFVEGDYPRL